MADTNQSERERQDEELHRGPPAWAASENYVEILRDITRILGEPGAVKNLVQRIISTLWTRTGLEAVGMRMQDGEDFPYVAQEGFPNVFLQADHTLIQRTAAGETCRDSQGNARLECLCGLVLSDKIDLANPFFTPAGSFWINDASALLKLPTALDPRHHPRILCSQQGYASMALIPIRNKNAMAGLIHLTDRRKGCFTFVAVKLLEEIAYLIGAVLQRKETEAENRRQLDELLRWQAALLHRSERAQDLKREVNALLHRLGEPARYPSQEQSDASPDT